MSINDFIIKKNGGNTQNGTAVLHSNLSNPLTGALAGDYCRGFNADPLIGSQESFVFSVNSSYQNGALVGIQNNKSISLRIAARLHYGWVPEMRMFCKATSSVASGDPTWVSPNFPSYSLMLKQTNLILNTGVYQGDQVVTTILQNLNYNTWHRLRMDVIPYTIQKKINGVFTTIPYKDRINIYTGSGEVGNETWSLINTTDISVTASNYVPWGNYTWNNYSITSSVGFGAISWGGGNDRIYVDRFEVLTGSV